MSQLSPTERAWATGLAVFAAAMMLVSGIFQALQGLAALANSEFFVVGRKYTFQFDITAWGWIHLLLGIGVAVVGAFLYLGANWARWTAIVLVGLSMFANFMWLPHYPIWGLVILALDVAIVWALASMDVAEA
jgi:hypothetical protein